MRLRIFEVDVAGEPATSVLGPFQTARDLRWSAAVGAFVMIDDITLARAIHVLTVVHWIGGLAFVTLIVLPFIRSSGSTEEGFAFFESVERRFSWQLRFTVPIAGAAGLWMTWRMQLWERFLDPHFWWMAAMLLFWIFFMAMIFLIEPSLHDRFRESVSGEPFAAFRAMMALHAFLLICAAAIIFGAVAGAHGAYF